MAEKTPELRNHMQVAMYLECLFVVNTKYILFLRHVSCQWSYFLVCKAIGADGGDFVAQFGLCSFPFSSSYSIPLCYESRALWSALTTFASCLTRRL